MKLQEYIKVVDDLIEKIPIHIRDIIQKAALAALAFMVLLAIIIGIQMGMDDAKPGGMQLAGSNRDLFYIQELREENDASVKLVEDIEAESNYYEKENTSNYLKLGPNRHNHMLGEKSSMLKEPKSRLRDRKKESLFLEEEILHGNAGLRDEGRVTRNGSADNTINDTEVLEVTPVIIQKHDAKKKTEKDTSIVRPNKSKKLKLLN